MTILRNEGASVGAFKWNLCGFGCVIIDGD